MGVAELNLADKSDLAVEGGILAERREPEAASRVVRWANLRWIEGRLHARLALDPAALRDACALRYRAYAAEGHIDPDPAGLFSDHHDAAPGTRTVVVYGGGAAVGSVRMCLMRRRVPGPVQEGQDAEGSEAVPGWTAFPIEIAALLDEAGKTARAVEITRLVTCPDRSPGGVVFALLRLASHLVTEMDADVVLSCVRPHHARYYRRMRMRPLAGPRPYPGVRFETVLLACRRAEFAAARRGAPVLHVGEDDRRALAGLLAGDLVPVSVPVSADARTPPAGAP